MKRTLIVAGSLGLGVILSGCAGTGIKHLSGADFLKEAEQISEMNSYSWTSYVGCSQQRAYLEYGHAAFLRKGTRTTVYWTSLSELPVDIAQQLKEGNTPW